VVQVGLVGLPNVGKSTFFNLLCSMSVPAEHYPFCTIDPAVSRVEVPDERFDFLCDLYSPASKVPANLQITDIAGLVKGAAEGAGLGNAFLSHIQAVDCIFHVIRLFEDADIIHVDDEVNPVSACGPPLRPGSSTAGHTAALRAERPVAGSGHGGHLAGAPRQGLPVRRQGLGDCRQGVHSSRPSVLLGACAAAWGPLSRRDARGRRQRQ